MMIAADCAVPELIAEIARSHPESIAVSDGTNHLNYKELDLRANRFARYLLQLGVVPGGAVAICMERSFDWIVAALGIMRAGAAYVPLDSAWPDDRLGFAIEDSGAAAFVARAPELRRVRGSARSIDPCRDADAIAAANGFEFPPARPESLAYVIYTSGSAGRPKGVEITHANLVHLVQWHLNAFGVTQQDRASHLAGLGFDAAVWELWPHLSAGATLCLPGSDVRSSPQLMQQWMIRERVTIGFVPTVHAKAMMTMEWPTATALRFLLTGGEALLCGPCGALPFQVVNNYGPTECTVVSTSSVLQHGCHGEPPIGLPITGASVYLLGEQGNPVPDGTVGEIYIGGNGVGRGYRNLPGLSERSFLPDPFASAPGARMYRTGDRGLRRPDGQVSFCGRLDRQIKVRGQRVELDEIGNVLSLHPAIDFATAIANNLDEGNTQIVGYVLTGNGARVPSAEELQLYLAASLPDYMIPAVFVRLDTVPLTLNGKIDFKKLPKPAAANLVERSAEEVIASPIAERLLTITRELLDSKTVTMADNFFLAGGHSLLAMQLLVRLKSSFGTSLTLQQLFQAPTVTRLAATVEQMIIESIGAMTDSEVQTHLQG